MTSNIKGILQTHVIPLAQTDMTSFVTITENELKWVKKEFQSSIQ